MAAASPLTAAWTRASRSLLAAFTVAAYAVLTASAHRVIGANDACESSESVVTVSSSCDASPCLLDQYVGRPGASRPFHGPSSAYRRTGRSDTSAVVCGPALLHRKAHRPVCGLGYGCRARCGYT